LWLKVNTLIIQLKFPLVLLLMLALISQAFASEIFEHHSASQHQMSATSMHTMMNMAMDTQSMEQNQDCCQQQCSCFMPGCFSLLFYPALTLNVPGKIAEPIAVAEQYYFSFAPKSLYRPPIFWS
jgi:hypothetical protein